MVKVRIRIWAHGKVDLALDKDTSMPAMMPVGSIVFVDGKDSGYELTVESYQWWTGDDYIVMDMEAVEFEEDAADMLDFLTTLKDDGWEGEDLDAAILAKCEHRSTTPAQPRGEEETR